MSVQPQKLWDDDISLEGDKHKVMIIRDQLVDAARDNRPVKIKVYYPVLEHNKNVDVSGRSAPARLRLPVIVWSHGLGGSVDGAAFLSRFIASHAYVVVHVQHFGTDSSLWEGKPGHPWDIIRQMKIPREATLNRFSDIPFALNQLPAWMEAHPEVGAIADLETIGMSGHSFGALTTQVMGGMMFPDEKGILRNFREERFQAGILYSPGPIEHLGLDAPEDIYSSITLPMFHMTGTDDSSPVEDWDYRKRLVVYENTTQASKTLMIIKDGDHMVFNGSRGKLGQNPNRELHEEIIKITALAYWDAKLKESTSAQQWLTGQGVRDYLGDNATFQ